MFVWSPTRKHPACVQARSRSEQADSDARCKTNEETGDSAARLTISATNIPRSVLPQRCNPVPNGLDSNSEWREGFYRVFDIAGKKIFFLFLFLLFIIITIFFLNRIDYAYIRK